MKIQIKKIGNTSFGSWCVFNAIINNNYVINGIASFDADSIELKEGNIYDDLVLYSRQKNGRVYYKIIIEKKDN